MVDIIFYRELVAAIIKQAIKDYEMAYKVLLNHPNNKNAQDMIKDCETFFLSDIEAYSDVDGKKILKNLKELCEGQFKKENCNNVKNKKTDCNNSKNKKVA